MVINMRLDILLKIKENKKVYNYLLNNSYWYRRLNRSPDNYNLFIKEYKKYNRENNMNKINDAIDNAELISNVIKIID